MLESQKTPLVSVIMIFLNAEKFIQDAIESVAGQTYPNWELIFVDDGSSDAGTEIALRYVREHPGRMRYFEHEGHQNRGMSASRNLGIQRSHGEYITFLDADDVYLPEKLEQHVALLSAHPNASMVYDTTQYWYSWTGRAEDAQLDRLRSLGAQTGQLYPPPAMFVRFLQDTANTPATCSVLIRRAAIDRVGGFEQSFSGMLEDQVFFHKFCLHEPVYVESGFSSRYRQHPDSHCYVSRRSGYWDPGAGLSPARAAFLHWLEAYLVEQNVTDEQIWRPLRKELWSYHHPRILAVWYFVQRLKDALSVRVRRLIHRKESLA
jgi:glycosyltransferase involved in cell wall biosynthesis